QKGHGVAFGDLRNNGQEDIFEVIGGAYAGDTYQSGLFANPGHENHWITLELQGVQTNRAAFGTRVCVKVQMAEGSRRIYRTVGFGSSFGQNPFRQHIGLGHAKAISDIEITWPTSKLVQHFKGPPLDSFFQVREGDSELHRLKPQQFAYPLYPVMHNAHSR
ncbi:MAG TPA: ASPIC/UnbV domain-containing protein, partial [Candidatus Angelobacter sp.]|nr:ASPIC/UnbV domain-containing protein [Candidatus Angelobacter sp.]